MTEKQNALAELAERLDAVLPYVMVECGVNEIDKRLTSKRAKDFIVAARHIVAELAKAYAIKRKLESQISTEAIDVWSKTMEEWVEADGCIVDRCRVIAEEGGAK